MHRADIITNSMNFKIQQTYPSPPAILSHFNTLTYASHINSLVLYGQQKGESQPSLEQPKKKIAFKADKSAPVVVNDKISVYSIANRKWECFQGQGKIPPPRSDFQAIYMKPCIVIYGGKSSAKITNDVYALNCQNWTWKKLFSLDGPPPAEDFIFFQISHQTAGLIVSETLWLLQLVDVKWELTANELPGSVWEKLNLQMPDNIKFCWPIGTQELLVAGQTQTVKINLSKKQIVSRMRSLPPQFWESNQTEKQGRPRLFNFDDRREMREAGPIVGFFVTSNSIKVLKFTDSTISPISENQNQFKVELSRPIKCCAFASSWEEFSERIIFYLDSKGQLFAVIIQPELAGDSESNSSRAPEVENKQMVIRSNSCIVEEQENEESSILVPSTSSRINVSSNQRIKEAASIDDDNQTETQGAFLTDSRLQNRQDYPKSEKFKEQQAKSWKPDPMNSHQNKRTNSILMAQVQPEQVTKHKQDTSRKNIYNLTSSQTNPTERQRNKERFKHQEQQEVSERKMKGEKSLETYEGKNNHGQGIQLKIKLDNILYSQSVKRKLLESKVDALQNVIKKSQKFVLMLCKYGNEPEKQRHIERVREIRQQLEANWSKQIYYRRQMETNKMPSQISQQIQETMNHIEY